MPGPGTGLAARRLRNTAIEQELLQSNYTFSCLDDIKYTNALKINSSSEILTLKTETVFEEVQDMTWRTGQLTLGQIYLKECLVTCQPFRVSGVYFNLHIPEFQSHQLCLKTFR
jgi:hypothetical protein